MSLIHVVKRESLHGKTFVGRLTNGCNVEFTHHGTIYRSVLERHRLAAPSDCNIRFRVVQGEAGEIILESSIEVVPESMVG